MILPPALFLGVSLLIPVVDRVPSLNVEQVCDGIAQQGGVSFHDPNIAVEKRNCLDSEQAIRDELVKQWSYGRRLKLHRAPDLPGNGP
jgi:hypothetical protein